MSRTSIVALVLFLAALGSFFSLAACATRKLQANIFMFFFFYWYGDHRDLHSFPTRRSSDLDASAGDPGTTDWICAPPPFGASVGVTPRNAVGPMWIVTDAFPATIWAASARTVLIGIADRKSTRLNSSHPSISYAVFCLKKKN